MYLNFLIAASGQDALVPCGVECLLGVGVVLSRFLLVSIKSVQQWACESKFCLG